MTGVRVVARCSCDLEWDTDMVQIIDNDLYETMNDVRAHIRDAETRGEVHTVKVQHTEHTELVGEVAGAP